MYSSMVSIPAEIVAAGVIIQFWIELNNSIWLVVFGFLLLVTNLCFVRVFGEIEFTSSCLKIMLILGLNIMVRIFLKLLSQNEDLPIPQALVITCGGGPNGESYGFRYNTCC